MAEPKLISPLLDGFAIGSASSSHDGVRCYPAMREESDEKYIVKVISIPASSTQLEALLLSGAYPDAQAARSYFESLVSDVENEAQVLHHFAKLEGFLAYEGYQVVPMDDGIGFDVYLLGTYKRSLANFFRKKPMTHLGALNLGIDLCAAMAICRQAGCLYIDIKPENIFITEEGRYCIGDLGFIPLSSLKYSSLPDKYRSRYTAPEVVDAFSSLNTTMDIYAIGLILYQAYNNGTLPFEGSAPAEPLPPPMYADYEMADIILKACAPKPEDRWQDPKQLGQALVSYMQRNGANDTPIVPPAITVEADDAEDFLPEEEEPTETPENSEMEFFSDLTTDETAPSPENEADLEGAVVSGELSEILAQAEELLSHETPGPVVEPIPNEIPMPEPIVIEADDETSLEEAIARVVESEDEDYDEEDEDDDEDPEEKAARKAQSRRNAKKVAKTILTMAIWLMVVAGLAFGVYYFYNNYYIQTIDDVTLEGHENTLVVNIDTEADDALLSVVCTDIYGATKRMSVVNGTATFHELRPGSQYTINLEIDGFHKLVGQTNASYATPPQTNILSFNAIVGPEDGSVILSFTVDGHDADIWSVVYSAEGEEEKVVSFSGHTTTISGLTVGKDYTFRLEPGETIYLVGATELQFVAPRLILAENLTVSAYDGEKLTITWEAPADAAVNGWHVRCYNESGYEVSKFAEGCTATLSEVDVSSANTIEVTADGMTQCVRTFITANPVTVTQVNEDSSDPNALTFQWDFVGNAPDTGWLLVYTMDGNTTEEVIQCEENNATLSTVIPGRTYSFTIQAANGATLFNGTFEHRTPEAVPYAGYGVTAENMKFKMCKTPDVPNWNRFDISDEDYTNTFNIGEKASFLVYLNTEYNVGYEEVVTLFVIRDASGNLVSAQNQSRPWIDMWRGGYCELDVPSLPETAGEYTIEVYFDGASVTTQNFTMQ